MRIGVHLIFGLIGENDEKMMKSVQTVAELAPDEVKLHLLYVLKNTKMAEIYANGGVIEVDRARYVDLVLQALEYLPPHTVIGRLTGDAPRKELIAPLWSVNKSSILNEIDKKFYERDGWQGKSFKPLC